jgi:hypothetical protein
VNFGGVLTSDLNFPSKLLKPFNRPQQARWHTVIFIGLVGGILAGSGTEFCGQIKMVSSLHQKEKVTSSEQYVP